MLGPGPTHLMRLLFLRSSSVQSRSRWKNPSSVTLPQIQWNLASAIPFYFMSTSPLYRHSDRTEVDPSSLELSNTTTPNWNPSSNESENQLVLGQSGSIEAYFPAAKDDYSLVDAPWEERSLTVRPPTPTALVALRQRKPLQLLPSILDEFPGFFASLPNTLILQIVRSLDPSKLIHRSKLIFENVHHPGMMKRLSVCNGSLWNLSADIRLAFEHVVESLFFRRQNLGFMKYQLLLKVASATGDQALASETWQAMLAHNHKPDVVCYNYYLEAMCWHLSGRYLQNPHGPKNNLGVKGVVTTMFAKMVAEGVMADSKTFALLMTACASEGDLESVKIILKKAWHVDVDAILQANMSENHHDPLPVSALPPTSDLLFTVAYCYGSNANVPVAMRIIHHLSHRFSLQIDDRTWDQLARCTYFISRRTSRSDIAIEESKRIPNWASIALYYAMASTALPTMTVLNQTIWSFYQYHSLADMLKLMIQGLDRYKRSSSTYFNFVEKTEALENKKRLSVQKLVGPSFSASQYKTRLARLEMERDYDLIRQWVRMVTRGRHWLKKSMDQRARKDNILIWQRQKFPEFMDVFRPYYHQGWGVEFRIQTGTVWLRDWRQPWPPLTSWDFDLNEYLVEDTSPGPTH